ncbi:MAG: hypothetical protein QW292_12645 [Candidatus Parvarchaeota archaeon]
MKAKGLGVLLVVLIMVFSAIGAVAIFGSMDTSQFNATGAGDVPGYGIGSEVMAVWGYNTTAGVWHNATLTLGKTLGNSYVKASIHFARNATDTGINILLIQTSNTNASVYNLLQQNILFENSSLVTTEIGHTGLTAYENLSAAGLFFGFAINTSSTNSRSDKGISMSDYNVSLYSATANNLNGKAVELSPEGMFASIPTAMPQYAFWLTPHIPSNFTNVAGGSSIVFQFYQNWERTAGMPLYTDVGLVVLAFSVLAALIVYVASPEHYDREDERAARWYQGEKGWKIAGAIGVVLLLAILVGVMGTATPLGGWGGAIALLFGFGSFVWAYTSEAKRQKYSRAILVGAVGSAIFIAINFFIQFGTITYNLGIVPDVVDNIAFYAALLVMLGLAGVGLINTGRYKLRERYARGRSRTLGRHA